MTLPRVTQILARVGLTLDYEALLPPEKLQMLRQRGTALHKAIEWYDRGTLDMAALHPDLVPGVEAYAGWASAVGHRAIATEPELVHDAWQYVGHPDRIGVVAGEVAIVDWKFTDSLDLSGGRYQCAGYRMLWNAQGREQAHKAYLVGLSPSGKGFKMHDVTSADAEQVFQAAVILYRALTENR